MNFNPESTSKIIEETYSRALTKLLNGNQTGSAPKIQLAKFLHDYLLRRFQGKKKLVDLMVCSITYSCFVHQEKFNDCELFFKFLVGRYSSNELFYFVFIRTIVEKQTGKKFFDKERSKFHEARNYFLSSSQLSSILERIFGFGNTTKINRFKQKLFEFDKSLDQDSNIHVYIFLKVAMIDYHRCKKYGKNYGQEMNDISSEQLILDLSPAHSPRKDSPKKHSKYIPDRPMYSDEKNEDASLLLASKLDYSFSPSKPGPRTPSGDYLDLEPVVFTSLLRYLPTLLSTLLFDSEDGEIELDEGILDKENAEKMISKMILDKFKLFFKFIKSNDLKAFLNELGTKEVTEYDRAFFERQHLLLEIIQQEIIQGKNMQLIEEGSSGFWSNFFTHDVIATEIIRLVGMIYTCLKFKD